MISIESTLTSVLEIHQFFATVVNVHGIGWWFRGQSNSVWPLVPKAGRSPHHLVDLPGSSDVDLIRFEYWRKRAVSYHTVIPDNGWECLALAQHYGLATRLLDWTINPLVGTFFACADDLGTDGSVYCYFPRSIVPDSTPFPLVTPGIGGIAPRVSGPRMLNQRGVFTLHNPPTQTIKAEEIDAGHLRVPNLKTLRIPGDLKQSVLEHLEQYGINRSTLFPDLDGLSADVNVKTRQIAVVRAEGLKSGK